MTLEVLHYYNAPGYINLDDELRNGTIRFITLSGLCNNTIEVWELLSGQLFLSEMYSKFNEEYERSDSDYFFVDNKKTFYDWLDCQIIIPTYLIPNCPQEIGTHYQINIKKGYLEGYKVITVFDEPDVEIF